MGFWPLWFKQTVSFLSPHPEVFFILTRRLDPEHCIREHGVFSQLWRPNAATDSSGDCDFANLSAHAFLSYDFDFDTVWFWKWNRVLVLVLEMDSVFGYYCYYFWFWFWLVQNRFWVVFGIGFGFGFGFGNSFFLVFVWFLVFFFFLIHRMTSRSSCAS
jgi:hypothetical protein